MVAPIVSTRAAYQTNARPRLPRAHPVPLAALDPGDQRVDERDESRRPRKCGPRRVQPAPHTSTMSPSRTNHGSPFTASQDRTVGRGPAFRTAVAASRRCRRETRTPVTGPSPAPQSDRACLTRSATRPRTASARFRSPSVARSTGETIVRPPLPRGAPPIVDVVAGAMLLSRNTASAAARTDQRRARRRRAEQQCAVTNSRRSSARSSSAPGSPHPPTSPGPSGGQRQRYIGAGRGASLARPPVPEPAS